MGDTLKIQRISDLEELLKLEYEKLAYFEKEIVITGNPATKFDLQQRRIHEILPDIRGHEVEYAELLAERADIISIPRDQAESAAADLVHAVRHVENLPDPNRPEEIKRLLGEILRKLDDPGKIAAAKLKVTLPIIPAIVSYEMELDAEATLVTVWRRVKSLFRSSI